MDRKSRGQFWARRKTLEKHLTMNLEMLEKSLNLNWKRCRNPAHSFSRKLVSRSFYTIVPLFVVKSLTFLFNYSFPIKSFMPFIWWQKFKDKRCSLVLHSDQYLTSADLAIMIYHIHKRSLRWNWTLSMKKSIIIMGLWRWDVEDTQLSRIWCLTFWFLFSSSCFLASCFTLISLFWRRLSLDLCHLEIDILIDLCVFV